MKKICVCFYREEGRCVPQVLQALINLNSQVHIAVRYSGIKLVGELCDWLNNNPRYIGNYFLIELLNLIFLFVYF